MDAEEYKRRFGRVPFQDDLERINCTQVGYIGHFMCGVCQKHNSPRFMCGCFAVEPDKWETGMYKPGVYVHYKMGRYRLLHEAKPMEWSLYKLSNPRLELCKGRLSEKREVEVVIWASSNAGDNTIYFSIPPALDDQPYVADIGLHIVYVSLSTGAIWVRPKSMWAEPVIWPGGKERPRFMYYDEAFSLPPEHAFLESK